MYCCECVRLYGDCVVPGLGFIVIVKTCANVFMFVNVFVCIANVLFLYASPTMCVWCLWVFAWVHAWL